MNRTQFSLFLLLGLIIVVGIVLWKPIHSQHGSAAYIPAALQTPSKTAACLTHDGLPDAACTPGGVDPAVTQDNIQQTICVSGYTKTVRPPVSVTSAIKTQEMAAYGFTDSPKNYELDHLIPLELGGAPADIANLWPEPALPEPGFHQKDLVENYLHTQVCSGSEPLRQAQETIAGDWVAVYRMIPQ